VVEIGTFHGWSTTWIFQTLRDNGTGHLYSYDVLDPSPMLGTMKAGLGLTGLKQLIPNSTTFRQTAVGAAGYQRGCGDPLPDGSRNSFLPNSSPRQPAPLPPAVLTPSCRPYSVWPKFQTAF
jgi:hypothetical protein